MTIQNNANKILADFHRARLSNKTSHFIRMCISTGSCNSNAWYLNYFASIEHLDNGNIRSAERIITEYFSAANTQDRLLLSLFVELADYCVSVNQNSRLSTDGCAINVEYPLYLYREDELFTALHPQYKVLKYNPPYKWRFITSQVGISSRYTETVNTSESLAGFFIKGDYSCVDNYNARFYEHFIGICRKHNVAEEDIFYFFSSRKLAESQLVPNSTQLLFMPTYLWYLGAQKWILWIENWSTLFREYLASDDTSQFNFSDSKLQPLFIYLSMPNCIKIITHMRSTYLGLTNIFSAFNLNNKIAYIPLAYHNAPPPRRTNGKIKFLFLNSHGACSRQFAYRGGFELLSAFSSLDKELNDLYQLEIVGNVPWNDFNKRECDFLTSDNVRLINNYLSDEEIGQLYEKTDFFVIPSISLHSCCVVQALSYGVPVIATDVWGYDEFITDSYNGFLVKRGYKYDYFDSNKILRELSPEDICGKRDDYLVANLVKLISDIIAGCYNIEKLSMNSYVSAKRNFNIDLRNYRLALELEDYI